MPGELVGQYLTHTGDEVNIICASCPDSVMHIPLLDIRSLTVLPYHVDMAEGGVDVVKDSTETNKGRGAGYSFRFMPDGSTDLAGSASPTLSLVYRTDADKTSLDNINFFTLQIDQQTGTVRTFRPQ